MFATLAVPVLGETVRVEPTPPPEGADCAFNEVRMAPGGLRFAVWQDRRVAMVSPAGKYRQSRFALGAGDGRLAHFRVDGEISALHWTRTPGQLEFLLDGNRWVRIDAATMRVMDAPIDPRWHFVSVRNDRWGGLGMMFGAPRTRAWLDAGMRPIRLFQTALAGEDPVFLHVDAQSLAVQGMGAPVDLGVPFDVAHLSAGPDGVDVAGRGRRLVRDPASGAPVGTISPGEVRLARAGAGGTGLLKDAERAAGRRALLGADADGVHWLDVLADRGVSGQRQRTVVCGDVHAARRAPVSGVVSMGAGRLAMAGLWHRHAASPGDGGMLVVRFQGGPFAAVADDYPAAAVRRLVLAGFSVVEPDYAGSRGVGVDRVPRLDAAAIAEANDALVAWARGQGYRRLLVVGESLGALPAIDLAGRYARESAGLVLLAPLMTLEGGRDLGRRALGANRVQALAEATAFGEPAQRAQLSLWLAQRVAALCGTGGHIVFVGSDDRVTPVSDQPPCLAGSTVVIPGGTHATVAGDDRTWAQALPWIAARVTAKERAHGG